MALVGVSADAVQRIESDTDPDKGTENATKFLLGTITARQRAALMDAAAEFITGEDGEGKARMMPFTASYQAVRLALRGWENFKDEKGNDLEFMTEKSRDFGSKPVEVATDATLDLLGSTVIQELGSVALSLNQDDPVVLKDDKVDPEKPNEGEGSAE